MKNTIKHFLQLTVVLCIALVNTGFAQMETLVDVTRNFSGIEKVEVSGGSLEISYTGRSSSNEVEVEAYLESTNNEQDIIFITVGNVLKISHKMNNNNRNNWSNSRTKGHIRIQGPKEMELEMTGGSGSVKAENVSGSSTYLSVGSGSIVANNISGDLFAKAGSGSIKIDKVDGDVEGKVGSGSTTIRNVDGNLKYSSGSGGINASDIMGTANISLTSGNAKLENIGELGAVKITSGNLNANNAGLGEATSLNGTSGNIKIKTPSDLREYNYNLSATSGNITVGNSRGGKNLAIDNGAERNIKGSVTSGNISITNN